MSRCISADVDLKNSMHLPLISQTWSAGGSDCGRHRKWTDDAPSSDWLLGLTRVGLARIIRYPRCCKAITAHLSQRFSLCPNRCAVAETSHRCPSKTIVWHLSISGLPTKEWGAGLMKVLPKALEYIKSQGRCVNENVEAWWVVLQTLSEIAGHDRSELVGGCLFSRGPWTCWECSWMLFIVRSPLWSDLRTTHLLLGEMNIHHQPDHQHPKALILDWCKHRKVIDHLINYATSEWWSILTMCHNDQSMSNFLFEKRQSLCFHYVGHFQKEREKPLIMWPPPGRGGNAG